MLEVVEIVARDIVSRAVLVGGGARVAEGAGTELADGFFVSDGVRDPEISAVGFVRECDCVCVPVDDCRRVTVPVDVPRGADGEMVR